MCQKFCPNLTKILIQPNVINPNLRNSFFSTFVVKLNLTLEISTQ